MFVVNEKDFEYRFGDSGPKYLMKGPRMNYALVQFQPGQDFQAHYHNVMEENFYILEGKVDIVVDGVCHTLSEGDFIHIEPGEVHYVKNAYDQTVKMVSTLAPFQEVDKVNVDNPVYLCLNIHICIFISKENGGCPSGLASIFHCLNVCILQRWCTASCDAVLNSCPYTHSARFRI